MIERLLASRLTTTTRVSSEVRAMVVELVGAAAGEDGSVIRTEKPAAATNRAVLQRNARLPEKQHVRLCDLFMAEPPSSLYTDTHLRSLAFPHSAVGEPV